LLDKNICLNGKGTKGKRFFRVTPEVKGKKFPRRQFEEKQIPD